MLGNITGVSDVMENIKDNIKRIAIQLEDFEYVFYY